RAHPGVDRIFDQKTGDPVIDVVAERRDGAVNSRHTERTVFAVLDLGLEALEETANQRCDADVPSATERVIDVGIVAVNVWLHAHVVRAGRFVRGPANEFEVHPIGVQLAHRLDHPYQKVGDTGTRACRIADAQLAARARIILAAGGGDGNLVEI